MRFICFILALALSFSALAETLVEKQWQFAEGLFKRKFYTEALGEYQDLIKKYPEDNKYQLDTYLRLSECYEALSQYKDAQKSIEVYIKHSKDEARQRSASYRLGLILKKAKDNAQAELIFAGLLKKQDDISDLARYELAGTLLTLNKVPEALKHYQRLAGRSGQSAVSLYSSYALGNYYRDHNKELIAQKFYDRVIKEGEQYPELKKQSYLSLAYTYHHQQELSKAQLTYENAFALFPELIQEGDNVKNLVKLYILQGKNKQAIKFLLKQKKRADDEYYLLSLCYFSMQEYEQCLKMISSIKNDQAFKDIGTYKLKSYYFLKKTEELEALATRYMKEQRNDQHAWETYYLCAQSLGQTKESLPYYQALYLQDLKDWPFRDDALSAYAQVLEGLDQKEQLEKVWAKISSFSDSPLRETAFLKQVESLKKRKRTLQAIKRYEIYLTEFTKGKYRSYVEFELVKLFLANKQDDKATSLLQELISKEANAQTKASYQAFLGRYFYDKKQYKKSIAHFNSIAAKDYSQNDRILCGYAYLQELNEKKAAETWNAVFLKETKDMTFLKEQDYLEIAKTLDKLQYQQSTAMLFQHLSQSSDQLIKAEATIGLIRWELSQAQLKKAQKLISSLEDISLAEGFRSSLLSLQAEHAFLLKDYDAVLQYCESAERLNFSSQADNARMLYCFASVLYEKKQYKNAQRYANRTFMIFNNNTYSPRSMLLAIRIYHKLNKKKEARLIAKELRKRFLSFYSREEVINYLEKNLLDPVD